ncbi:MAG: hypothetical protein M3Q56_05615 [Bacteroidota bacterium]|nr:hypothetical protein [Bacteroidota bacterium]
MNRNLSRFLKITFFILGLLLVLGLLLPLLYKKEIVDRVKNEANASINGHIDFSDVSISIFRYFPKLSLSLKDLEVNSYVKDSSQILSAKNISLAFNLWNLLSRKDALQIKLFEINDAEATIIYYEDDSSNLDITKPTEAKPTSADSLEFGIEKYILDRVNILYADLGNGTNLTIKNLNHVGQGDFSNALVNLKTETQADSVSFTTNGITYMKDLKLQSTLDLLIDQNKNLIELKENSIQLNALQLKVLGQIQELDSQHMNIQFDISSPGSDFKELFSLIPYAYSKNYANVESKGKFDFSAKVNGVYSKIENTYPSWNIKLNTANGFLKYPEKSVKLEEVNLNFESKNPGPDLSQHTISVTNLHLLLNNNPIDGNFYLNNIQADPHAKGNLKGNLSLDDLKNFLPLEPGIELSGLIQPDLDFDFTESQVRTEKYDQIKLLGQIGIKNLKYKDPTMPLVAIPELKSKLTSQSLTIETLDMNLGKSDLHMTGVIINPLALMVDKGISKANINFKGNLFDINEWMNDPASSSLNATAQKLKNKETPIAVELINKLNLTANGTLGKLIYDDYSISNVSANAELNQDKLQIRSADLIINNNSLHATGYLNDPVSFAYDLKKLNGKLNLSTRDFNMNSFMGTPVATIDKSGTNVSPTTEVFLVPKNMDLDIQFNVGKFLYDKLNLANLKGNLVLNNDEMQFHNITSEALGGEMALSGVYSTKDPGKPVFDLKYDLKKLKFINAYESVLSIKLLAPIAKYIDGIFNSSFVASGSLGKDMMPDLNSLDLNGLLETINGSIKNFKPLQTILSKLNIDGLKELSLQDTKNWISVTDGTVLVKESSKMLKDVEMKYSGSHKISGPMDYIFKFRIPRSKFNQNQIGQSVESGLGLLKNLASKAGISLDAGSHINVMVQLTGLYNNPKIQFKLLSPDGTAIEEGMGNMVEDAGKKILDSAKTRANEEMQKVKDKALKEAKRYEDSLRAEVERKVEAEKKKLLDKAGKEASKKLDSILVNKGKDIFGNKTDSTSKNPKQIDDIKDKLKEWDPFKKKKKE